MKSRLGLFFCLFTLFFALFTVGCARTNAEKAVGGLQDNSAADSKEQIAVEDNSALINEPEIKPEMTDSDRRLLFFIENISGYYNLADYTGNSASIFFPNETYTLNEHLELLAFISIVEDELIISRFNIIHGEHIYEELLRFDINSNDRTGEIRLTNGNYRFWASWNMSFMSLSVAFYGSWVRANFQFISNEIDEKLMEYTYDYQKQFVGSYLYDSHTFWGMESEEFHSFFNRTFIRRIEETSREIGINNRGLLFSNTVIPPVYFRIINNTGTLFSHSQDYGQTSTVFSNGTIAARMIIYWEVIENDDGEDEYIEYVEEGIKGWEILYKKQ